ncbi:DEAD/DEAH box helicase, partial [Salinispira pacifica]
MHTGAILCPLPRTATVLYGGEGQAPLVRRELTRDLAAFFAPAVRARGDACFGRGAVHVISSDVHGAEAVVTGERRYRTVLEFHDGFVGLVCSCPFFTGRGLPCKHLWALLLSTERGAEQIRCAPRPRLSLLRAQIGLQQGKRQLLSARLSFGYRDYIVDNTDPPKAVYFRSDNVMVYRSPRDERDARALLRSLGFRPSFDPETGVFDDLTLRPKLLPPVVETLLEGGWYIEAEGRILRRAKGASFVVSSGIDWFESGGSFDFENGSVSFPEVLRSLRHGGNLVPLGDGTYGVLPAEWLRMLNLTSDLGVPCGESVRFHPGQAAVIEMLLRERGPVTCDETFRRLRERLDHFADNGCAEPAGGFRGSLRDYQKRGLAWLRFLEETGFGGCLADEMGLGKTVQVLALLAERGSGEVPQRPPALIVVPRSIVFNWMNEARRFTPELRVTEHEGSGRAGHADGFEGYDIVITTYGILRNDILRLRHISFDWVILDEAQAVKNPKSTTAKAARLLCARRRLALTGTPVENHLGDLWSIFEFLNPGMLGTLRSFRRTFMDRRDGNPDPEPATPPAKLLSRLVRPFLLRRTKAEVAPELPERIEA